MNELIRMTDVETTTALTFVVDERQQEREQRRRQLSAFLDAIYADGYGSDEKERMSLLWDEQRDLWLKRQKSEHTRMAYARALREFKAFLWERFAIRYLWFAEGDHTAAWLDYMKSTGSALAEEPKALSDRTINQRLAALSSYYNHMTNASRLVDGRQIGLFVSADGYPRSNPFRSGNLERPEVQSYGDSTPIPTKVMQSILRGLAEKQNKSLADKRDYALLLTFYRTGYRADSVLQMKWGEIKPKESGEGTVFKWRGKGGKEKRKAFPDGAYHAIVAYLKADGRYAPGFPDHIEDDEFIWRPLRTHGVKNFGNADEIGANRHITQSTANEMLRRRLKNHYIGELRRQGLTADQATAEAEKQAQRFHLHSLRHTFAHELDEASNGDIRLVSETLDHSRLETTRIYLGAIKDPEDKAVALLQSRFGF